MNQKSHKIEQALNDFFDCYLKKNQEIEIYNEFSFQHELGIFLRSELADYKIQFERNIKYFEYDPKDKNEKKEIDIVICNKLDDSEKYAIELKFANKTNGQHPEKMFGFIKDIWFMETVKVRCKGFVQNYCVTLVEDELFYQKTLRNKHDGIYQYFRGGQKISGQIEKPTGKDEAKFIINLQNSYQIEWRDLYDEKKFYIVKV
ncbi:hypothetical protein [Moraxella marmotae]|uniref:hypothetical protein n=1 Tax=Moraxella marmotae TaxID=3344520 RepID=UPI0035F4EF2E